MKAMKIRTRFVVFTALLLIIAGLVLPAIAAVMADGSQAVENHRKAVMEWRQKRHARLASDSGWLTLVGLEWLQEGENRIGSGKGNDVRLASGPDYWGTVILEQDKLRFFRAAGNSVTVDGAFPAEVLMVPDNEGTPTLVKSGNLSFHPIFRGSYALRIKDSQAPVRMQFKGIENYDVQWNWRIDGRFIPGEEGQTIQIANVLGQLNPMPMPGWFEFERDGKPIRLMTLGEEDSESLWIIFADRTNGHDTYGAGRFLYSDGMPETGRLVLDFNLAYNPPCAFNDYSTCPLPPQENRMDLAVTAGEKDFHKD